MATYNILSTMTVDFSVIIEIPSDVVKEGTSAIQDYAQEHFVSLAESGGLENLSRQCRSYEENSVDFKVEDCTRLKSDEDK